MIIDFHAHTYPDSIAHKALNNLSFASGGMTPCYNGTYTGLSQHYVECGVDYGVVLNIATSAKNQGSVNDFAAKINGGNLIAFGSIFPDAPNVIDELYRIKEIGLKGVKLHPDYQGFFVNDDKMLPIYEKIAALGLITVFHSGVDIGLSPPTCCEPRALAQVLNAFSGAPVVAAHFGGYMLWDQVAKYLCGKNVYLDTSFSCGRIPRRYALGLVEEHGANKILLGSDMPWSDIADEIGFVKTLNLNEENENLILGENARRLLNITHIAKG